ncbi:MAG: hypothetical protein LBI71_12520 [Enterobacteriaceae bacterium]|jgi:hypothetical protein|nr:hypothetical protein [Enterobacteriaceae bacterium]
MKKIYSNAFLTGLVIFSNLMASTNKAWENGELGRSTAHIKVSDDITEDLINEELDLQPISIRLIDCSPP